MAYVLFDHRNQQYVAQSTRAGFAYTGNINEARVYKTKKGALDAAGEADKSYANIGKWPPSKKLALPRYFDIVEVSIEEGKVVEKEGGI